MTDEEKRIVEIAKGEFLTMLSGRWESLSGGWQPETVSNYIKEDGKIFQTRIFGRKVLEEDVYEQLNMLFENTTVKTHSAAFRELNSKLEPSWKK